MYLGGHRRWVPLKKFDCTFIRLQSMIIYLFRKTFLHSRTPVIRTLLGNGKQFNLAGNSSYSSSSYQGSTVRT